jgi:hypothetical protein
MYMRIQPDSSESNKGTRRHRGKDSIPQSVPLIEDKLSKAPFPYASAPTQRVKERVIAPLSKSETQNVYRWWHPRNDSHLCFDHLSNP